MSAIIQQPDDLSFSGNLKKLIISSAIDISFTLSKNGIQILNEVYSPNAGDLIEIDLRQIIHQELSIVIPTNTEIVNEQADGVAEFTATIDGDPVAFEVIRGGVFRLSVTATEWLGANFQSWQPQDKPVIYNQPEWLSIYAGIDETIRAKAYFADGSEEQIGLASLPAGKLYSVRVDYETISGQTQGVDLVAWDLWREDSLGAQIGYVQRYRLRSLQEQEHLFAWANTLGGVDTVSFTGHRKEDPKIESQLATLYDDTIEEYDDESKREVEQSTGYLNWYESKWLEDFFLSPMKFEIDNLGDLYRVAMTENEVVNTTQEDIFEYLLTFRYAGELPFLNIKRSTMALPDFIPEEINLPPLFRDLPVGAPDGTWILAVQKPGSPTWYQMSIDQLFSLLTTDPETGEQTVLSALSVKISGVISYKSDLTYIATDHVARILGVKYTAQGREITLEPADPNLPRKDIFVMDRYGNIFAVAGDPSANPIKPSAAYDQLELTHADIPAGATEPSNVEMDNMYDEGAPEEWAVAATSDDNITVDLADEIAPANGTRNISVTLAIPDAVGEAPTHYIGEEYGGGIICHLEPGGKKGMIAAKSDQSPGAPYQYSEYTNGTQDNVALGMGAVNTAIMMGIPNSNQAGMAAPLCVYFRGGGYDDWALPSKMEADIMRYNKAKIGGFVNTLYWTSTESVSDSRKRAVALDFSQAMGSNNVAKGTNCRVRAVRWFDDTQQSYTEPVEVYTPVNTKIELTADAIRVLNGGILSLWMKTSLPWLGNTALLMETYLNGVKTGGALLQAANAFGFDANYTEDWQKVIIQMYNFGLSTKQCDQVVFRLINSWPNGIKLEFDSVRMQYDPEQPEQTEDYGYRANLEVYNGVGPHAIQFSAPMGDTDYFPHVRVQQNGFDVGYASLVKRNDGFDITFNEAGDHTLEYLILKYK